MTTQDTSIKQGHLFETSKLNLQPFQADPPVHSHYLSRVVELPFMDHTDL